MPFNKFSVTSRNRKNVSKITQFHLWNGITRCNCIYYVSRSHASWGALHIAIESPEMRITQRERCSLLIFYLFFAPTPQRHHPTAKWTDARSLGWSHVFSTRGCARCMASCIRSKWKTKKICLILRLFRLTRCDFDEMLLFCGCKQPRRASAKCRVHHFPLYSALRSIDAHSRRSHTHTHTTHIRLNIFVYEIL